MSPTSLTNFQDPLWEALLRLAINMLTLFIVIRLIYFRYSRKRGNLFAFLLMGLMIFILCGLLKGVELQMGMALGLFAIFSIIRYRTRNLAAKDMSYLFTVIGISAINALFDYPHPVRGTILVNVIIILAILLLEYFFRKRDKSIKSKGHKKEDKNKVKKSLSKHQVLYDNLDLLNPDKMDDLIKDISNRTGFKIEKIVIKKIDLINSIAELDVFFMEKVNKKSDDILFQ